MQEVINSWSCELIDEIPPEKTKIIFFFCNFSMTWKCHFMFMLLYKQINVKLTATSSYKTRLSFAERSIRFTNLLCSTKLTKTTPMEIS